MPDCQQRPSLAQNRIARRPVFNTAAPTQEADHRIANSLQLVAAMLSSQSRLIGDHDARHALQLSVQRIAAIGAVHRLLSRSVDGMTVDIGQYLIDLTEGLRAGLIDNGIERRIVLDTIQRPVPHEFAAGLGVIVAELVVNACKYAFAPDEAGEIEIAFAAPAGTGDAFSLRVADKGAGRPLTPPSTGVGGRVLELMSRKIGGEGSYVPCETGTSFVLTGSCPQGC
jgi:two-component sensor histidine kinase